MVLYKMSISEVIGKDFEQATAMFYGSYKMSISEAIFCPLLIR